MREDVDATPWPHQSRYEHQPWRYGGGSHPQVPRSEYQKIADNLDFASATETRCPIYNFSKTAYDDLRQVLQFKNKNMLIHVKSLITTTTRRKNKKQKLRREKKRAQHESVYLNPS